MCSTSSPLTQYFPPVNTHPWQLHWSVAEATRIGNLSEDASEDLANVLGALGAARLTADVRNALLEEIPFGLWDRSAPGCNFTGVPTAGSYQGTSRPDWMVPP